MRNWLAAVWYVTNQKQGVTALGLQRVLGLGSYQTAWAMLHRLRRAMVRPGRVHLRGNVEVDETYIGGTESDGKKGRDVEKKKIVAIAIEVHFPKGFRCTYATNVPLIYQCASFILFCVYFPCTRCGYFN